MPQLFANNAVGVLNGSIGTGTSSIALVSSDAFPVPTGDDYFMATLIGLDSEGREDRWEIVKVTSNLLNVLTVERAQEGTEAQGWGSGATIELRVTAMSFDNKANADQVGTDVPVGAVFSDTTYGIGDGGLTQKNFTSTLKTKLDGISAGANNYAHPATHSIAEVSGLQGALDGKATSAQGTNADTAHGWGDHALEGYALGSDVVPSTGGTFTGQLVLESASPNLLLKETDTSDRNYSLDLNAGTLRIRERDDSGASGNVVLSAGFGGPASLFFGGVNKLSTNSAGVSVTGEVTTTDGNSNNWNTAYGWGNHASAGYASATGVVPSTGGTFTGFVTFSTGVRIQSDFLIADNGSRYVLRSEINGHGVSLEGADSSGSIKTCVVADPDGSTSLGFQGSTKIITTATGVDVTGTVVATGGSSTNWNTAYGWGDHSLAGYAPLASPVFTGTPQTVEPSYADYSSQIATTKFAKDLFVSNSGVADPDTTLESVILSNLTSTPDSSYYWHITTTFYASRSSSNNRAQIAVQYNGGARMYCRSRYSGVWTSWVRVDNDGPATTATTATTATQVADQNGGAQKIWTGTQAQYDALTPDASTLYFISG